jgi:peptide methionine sulfoxide reductase MsrA
VTHEPETAILAGGCFWALRIDMQNLFDDLALTTEAA